MSTKPEMLCKGETPGVKSWLKRQARRLRRRLGKKFLGDAPKKTAYRGWSM